MTARSLPGPDPVDPNPTQPFRTQLRRHPVAILVALGTLSAMLFAGGCGDDDDEDQLSNQETLSAELAGHEDFAQDIATSAPAQVVSSPQVETLLGNFGLVLGFAKSGSRLVPLDFDSVTRPAPEGSRVAAQLWSAKLTKGLGGIPYGTYERDLSSKAAPFPGWVFVEADPTDGFVFHFSEDDDFVVYEGLNERHISGEIRFLHAVFVPVGAELVLTAVEFELVVDPIPVPVIHIPFAGVLAKGTTQYSRVEFGDVSQPANLTNCYFGTLAFDFLHDETDPADIATTLLAVDTSQDPDYVLLLDLDQLNVTKEVPEEATVRFGFGHSDDPSSPALDVTANFTDIVYDPKLDQILALVAGTIEHHTQTIATFAGSTDEVQLEIDINGDGQVNEFDTCVDIDITFTDSGDTMNLCVALQQLAQSLPFLPDADGGSFRFGPLAF
jgi:hypothetical protein